MLCLRWFASTQTKCKIKTIFAVFRYQKSFHGVNLMPLHEEAMQEYFRQPIVDTFDIRICMSKSIKHSVDFLTNKESDLHEIGMKIASNLKNMC